MLICCCENCHINVFFAVAMLFEIDCKFDIHWYNQWKVAGLESHIVLRFFKVFYDKHHFTINEPHVWFSDMPCQGDLLTCNKSQKMSPLYYTHAWALGGGLLGCLPPQGQKVNVTGIPTPESIAKLITCRKTNPPPQELFPGPRMIILLLKVVVMLQRESTILSDS